MLSSLGFTQGHLAKAGTVSAAAYGIANVMGYASQDIQLYGRTIPFALFLAASAGTGSLLADMSHNTLFHYLPLSQKYDQVEAAATSAVVSTGAFYLATYAADTRLPGEVGVINMLGTTLLANAVGDYAYSTVLAPMFK